MRGFRRFWSTDGQGGQAIVLLVIVLMRPWGARDFRVADPFGYYLRSAVTLGSRSKPVADY
jgi:hypothetical protein